MSSPTAIRSHAEGAAKSSMPNTRMTEKAVAKLPAKLKASMASVEERKAVKSSIPKTRITKKADEELLAKLKARMPSVEERRALGKSLRDKVPHESHAQFNLDPKRADPVAIFEAENKGRLDFLVPIRYARMLASPFAFLRGSAAVMAGDLAPTPVTGLLVQACGDMHVANFGWYASAERHLDFGINDFDETLPGPWEWDLKRLAASAVVAVRFMGGDKTLCEESARAVVRSYRKHMREYAEMGNLDVWYARIGEKDILDALDPKTRKIAGRLMDAARDRGHTQVLEKQTKLVDDRFRIVEDKPLVVREARSLHDGKPIMEALAHTLNIYLESLSPERRQLLKRYRIADVARKVVGVGSVGTRCWVILMIGNSIDDPLFLQYKEASPSVLAPYLKATPFNCEGERVVSGQRLIQGTPDIFLGWGTQRDGRHFYIRQLRDMKASVEFNPENVKHAPEYCRLCGWALALAHATSGDPAAIAGYLGKSDSMDAALARFAFAYADQTERDHAALAAAARSKRIVVAKKGY